MNKTQWRFSLVIVGIALLFGGLVSLWQQPAITLETTSAQMKQAKEVGGQTAVSRTTPDLSKSTRFADLSAYEWIIWETATPPQTLLQQADTIWSGHYRGGLMQWHSQLGFQTAYTLPLGNDLVAIAPTSTDLLLGTLDGGLQSQTSTITSTLNVWDIAVDGSDYWLATWGDGLLHNQAGNWTAYNTLNSNIPFDDIYAVALDNNNQPWVGTIGYGIATLSGTTWATYTLPVTISHPITPSQILRNNAVTDIAIDANNQKWFATDGSGVAVLNATNDQWTLYNSQNSGLPDDFVHTIYMDGDYRWFGTLGGGVARYNINSQEWEVWNTENTIIPDNDVLGVAVDANDNFWFATYDTGLTYYGELPPTPQLTLDPAGQNPVLPRYKSYALWQDPNSYVWYLAWGSDATPHEFTGYLQTDGVITAVSPSPDITTTSNTITINDTHANAHQVISFTLSLEATSLYVGLQIDGAYRPFNMLVGDDLALPNTLPFQISTPQPVPPVAVLAPITQTVEGYATYIHGSYSDPDNFTGHTITLDLGDGTVLTDTLATYHTYLDDGLYTVILTVTDSNGLSDQATQQIQVNNDPPIVEIVPLSYSFLVNEPMTLTANIFDAGIVDTHTIAWDFGDGNSSTTLTTTHTFTATGTYSVTATVTDDDSGMGQDVYWVTISEPTNTGDWYESCTNNTQLDIIGMGMGNINQVNHNPATLQIADVATVREVLVQVVVKQSVNAPQPESVVIYTDNQTVTMTQPSFFDVAQGYYYEVVVDPTSQITAEVIGDGTDIYKTPRALLAYVFREDADGSASAYSGQLIHEKLHRRTVTQTLTIPADDHPRDVILTFAVADVEVSERIVTMQAIVNGQRYEAVVNQNNRGDELLIYDLLIPDVAGDVTSLEAVLISTDNSRSDSLYWAGVGANIACIPAETGRVSDSLTALYTFQEGAGALVTDQSGFGTPLTLTMPSLTDTTWLAGGGLANNGTLGLSSVVSASKIISASQASNEITIEAWIKPANANQQGPASILNLGDNLTLGHGAPNKLDDYYGVQVRRSLTETTNWLTTADGTATTTLTHLVYTRDAAGVVRLYLDGQLVETSLLGGNWSSWQALPLLLAEGWYGELHLVAFYHTALDQRAVTRNFEAGSGTTAVPPPPVSTCGYGPHLVPGRIELEDFACTSAYSDTSNGPGSGIYRTDVGADGPDLQATQDTSGNYNIGWTNDGEWMRYTISVTQPITYDLIIRAASPNGTARYHLKVDGVDVTGSLAPQATGGWQTWADNVVSGIALPTGWHTLELYIENDGANYNYIEVVEAGTAVSPPDDPPPPPPISTCQNSTQLAPTIIQIEDFNCGSAGIVFNDYQPFGPGSGAYRDEIGAEGPDLQQTQDVGGGYNLGWTEAGEWIQYTIAVTQTGTYDIVLRTASSTGDGQFRLYLDGVDVSGLVSTPDTDGWQVWGNVTAVTGLTLNANTNYTLELRIENGGANYNYLQIIPSD